MSSTQSLDPRRHDAASVPVYGAPLPATEPLERPGEALYYAGGWQPAPQAWLLRETHLWQAADPLNLNQAAHEGVQPMPQWWAAANNDPAYHDLEAPMPDYQTQTSERATLAAPDFDQYAGLRAPTAYDAY